MGSGEHIDSFTYKASETGVENMRIHIDTLIQFGIPFTMNYNEKGKYYTINVHRKEGKIYKCIKLSY